MNPLGNETSGKTAAFFDVQTDDGIILKGFRLVNGSNGIFMSSPDQKGKDGKYYETVTLPKEMKSELEKMAIEQYTNNSK